MGKIAELTKEKLRIRLSDPERAAAITMVLAEAANAAKAQLREATDEDVVSAAMSMVALVRGVITGLKKKGLTEFGVYEREIATYLEFIPEDLREKEPEPVDQQALIDEFVKGLSADMLVKSKRKDIMTLAKEVPGLDRGALNDALNAILK